MRLKTLFVTAALSLSIACSTPGGPEVRVYYSRPDLGGLYRKQSSELVKYEDSEGYYALNRPDFEALLNYCLNPRGKERVRTGIDLYLDSLGTK